MSFNNLDSILDCMKNWKDIRDDADKITGCLSKGNYFTLKRDKPEAQNLHAYPGIDNSTQEFYMFIIDAALDKNNTPVNLFNAITICKVEDYNGNSDIIPDTIARKRIEDWNNKYRDWATQQINFRLQTQGIFKAFNIPSSYMDRNDQYASFFALKESIGSVTGYQADIVTSKSSGGSKVYYDTVRPVPPFDVLPQSSFYLLSLI